MGGDLNARNPTKYIFNKAVESIDTPFFQTKVNVSQSKFRRAIFFI